MGKVPGRVVARYKARDGRIIPIARITQSGRVYVMAWARCKQCGARMLVCRKDAKYCSNKCRARAFRRRHADMRAISKMQEDGNPLFSQPKLI